MNLPLLHIIVLPKLPSMNMQNALSTILVFHTALVLTKKLSSQTEKYSSNLRVMGFMVLSCSSSWSIWLDRMVELLIMQLQDQLCGNSFKGQGRSLWKAIYALNQCSIHGTVYPTARFHESWNQEVEMEMFTITPREWLGKFLLPIPATLC